MSDEDDFWLEGGVDTGPLTIPVHGMRKADLAVATTYSPAKIDRLVRLGLPARRGRSNRDGFRFDLPTVIEWIAAHRAAEQGGGDDTSLAAAKRRKALADARLAEMETAKREGELVEAQVVTQWITNSYTVVRSRLLNLESEVVGLSAEQIDMLRDAIHDTLTEISSEAYERSVESEEPNDSGKSDAGDEAT